MLALIDGDIVVYRIGFTTQELDLGIAKLRLDAMMNNILSTVGATEHKVFLSDSTENGFRYQYNSQYKANRTAPKPKWYEELKEHMIVSWNARITCGEEADDGIGISASSESIVVSIDKDLHQIPGRHYNFVKEEYRDVGEKQGRYYFYQQLLTGDNSDNIKGIYGVGPWHAHKILAGKETDHDLFLATVEAYRKWLSTKVWEGEWDDFKENQMLNIILINGICLKIRQQEEEIWTFPLNTLTPPLLECQLESTP